jgi:hypothetical protein
MAESCPGTTKSSLEGIQAWYIRDETYSAALAELVNAQKKALWRHSGAMEQRHRLMDRTFGWGVTGVMLVRSILNTVRIQACRFIRIFRTSTARFTPKLSAACGIQHVLDGLLYHETDLEITEHYTDTAGFTEHVFALMHMLGFAFAPGSGIFMTNGCLFMEKLSCIRGFSQSSRQPA